MLTARFQRCQRRSGETAPAFRVAGHVDGSGSALSTLSAQVHNTLFLTSAFMTANSTKDRNRLRIIGGQWRSRIITFSDTPDLRPTPDRVRETLFNWLQLHITGARCLDLFAGSGILGLEALSRGASSVTAVELDTRAAASIRQQTGLLHTSQLAVVQENVSSWLSRPCPGPRFDVVFLDPPYASRLQGPCCQLLADGTWLNPGALIYLEAAEPLETLVLPTGWTLARSKRAADVHYGICKTAG